MIFPMLLTVQALDTAPAQVAKPIRPELQPIIGRCYIKNRPVVPKPVAPKPADPKPVVDKSTDPKPVAAKPADFAKIARSLSGDMVSVCLNGHNIPRRSAGLRPLTWSNSLQQSAQLYAQKLDATNTFRHSKTPGLGENLYLGTGSCANANSMWLAERVLYKGQAVKREEVAKYGHFTQMMWPSTTSVGCGISSGVVVCHYSPPGNMLGTRLTQY
jgi:uncharacterized protein YkwD